MKGMVLKKDASFIQRLKPAQAVEKGGFAGSVGTDQANDFSFLNLEVNLFYGFQPQKQR